MAPSKLTPEIQTQICNAIGNGLPVELTAELVGLSKATIYQWLRFAKKKIQSQFTSTFRTH